MYEWLNVCVSISRDMVVFIWMATYMHMSTRINKLICSISTFVHGLTVFKTYAPLYTF